MMTTNEEDKVMTREEIKIALEQTISVHGFPFEYTRWSGWLPNIPQYDNDYIGVTINDNIDYDCKYDDRESRITAQARVCRMNSNSDSAELLKAADQIHRGAKLMDAINNLKLIYTEPIQRAER